MSERLPDGDPKLYQRRECRTCEGTGIDNPDGVDEAPVCRSCEGAGYIYREITIRRIGEVPNA